MTSFDKDKIKESLTLENIYTLLVDFGGNPKYTNFGILSDTICHNEPGVGSRKLYFYKNSELFQCFTSCDYFDVIELVRKVARIQFNKEYNFVDAMRWLVNRFNLSVSFDTNDEENFISADWGILNNYDRIQEIKANTIPEIVLKEYDKSILNNFNYSVKIKPWLKEGITQKVLTKAKIGFYPGGDQITIPHFDSHNRFVGLRGRTLSADDAEQYGKYRPLKVNQLMYNHPLGMNLYNFNNAKDNIAILKKAIVVEGEKSPLLYQSYFGFDNDIVVACCGSNISAYQMQLLLNAGANEIIIAFDRQFKEKGDKEFQRLKSNLIKLRNRYKNEALISFIFDKNLITDYKSSPLDHGPDVFLKLFNERIVL